MQGVKVKSTFQLKQVINSFFVFSQIKVCYVGHKEILLLKSNFNFHKSQKNKFHFITITFLI